MAENTRLTRRTMLRSGLALTGAAAGAPLLTERAAAADAAPAHRQAAAPLAQDYTVIHHRENPRTYVEGCGMIVLENGAILAVVPVVPRGGVPKKGPTAIHVIRSDDGGKTWKPQSQLPFYSAVPFLHDGELYLFLFSMGKKFRNDDLFLAKSSDAGRTWTEPVSIFAGHFWNCHTGLVIRDGHIYWAVDELIRSTAIRSPRAIAGDLSGNLLDPNSWRMSNLIPFPGLPSALKRHDWEPEGIHFNSFRDHWLEANVVDVYGRLRMLATVKFQHQTSGNLCAVFDLHDREGKLEMEFIQFYPRPGGHLKFAVIYDEPSKLFWSTANLAVDSQETHDWYRKVRGEGRFTGSGGNDRRHLMLHYSIDALNWFQAGCVTKAAELRQSFMYGKPVVHGDDLLVISRTSIDAPNQHDADHATFHRVADFRSLALNLFPEV